MAQKEWVKLEDLAEAQLTPMLRQYLAAKAEADGALLFFRMGDFYELFFEDALEAAELLDLVVTSRDGPDTSGASTVGPLVTTQTSPALSSAPTRAPISRPRFTSSSSSVGVARASLQIALGPV